MPFYKLKNPFSVKKLFNVNKLPSLNKLFNLNNKPLHTQLKFKLLILSIIPIVAIGLWHYVTAVRTTETVVKNNLTSVLSERVEYIELYYTQQKDMLTLISNLPQTRQAFNIITNVFYRNGKDSEQYQEVSVKYIDLISTLEKHSQSSYYFISTRGHVVFATDSSDPILGENIRKKTYADHPLGRTYVQSRNSLEAVVGSYSQNSILKDEINQFIVAPLLDDGRLLGFMALQLSTKVVLNQLTSNLPNGTNAQINLAAPQKDGSILVISPSIHIVPPKSQITNQSDDQVSRNSVTENDGVETLYDYQGNEVIAAWRYLSELHIGVAITIERNKVIRAVLDQQIRAWLFSAGIFFLIWIIASLISRQTSLRITNLADAFSAMARGQLGTDLAIQGKDEIDSLAGTYNLMTKDMERIIAQINNISQGDFRTTIEPRSDVDNLSMSLQRLARSLHDTAQIAGQVARDDLSSHIMVKGEADRLGQALNAMISNLRERYWHQDGLDTISRVLRGQHHDLSALGRQLIDALCRYLGAPVGTIYTPNDTRELVLLGHYGIDANSDIPLKGSGLVTQVTQERKHILIRDLPPGYLSVKSSLGTFQPSELLIYPIVHNRKVQAVFELGTFGRFEQRHLRLLESLNADIGIHIVAVVTNDRQKELLNETIKQSAELKESQSRLNEQQKILQESNDELERQATSIAKQNIALEKARADAEKANQYKSELLANTSHELRTPLNSLLILSRILAENEEGNLTEEQIDSVKVIQEGGETLLSLINNILDLSKIEAGKMVLNTGWVDLNFFVSYIRRNFQHMVEQANLEFELDLDQTLPTQFYSDQVAMRQIVSNLLSNAIKFTTSGKIAVKVGHPDDAHAEKYLMFISISDTGIGISPDKQQIIFEAFQQADMSTSRRYGGTGLGLSICNELAQLLGGEIELQSEPQTGSTFTLYLPKNPPTHRAIVSEQAPDAPVPTTEPSDPVNAVTVLPSQPKEKPTADNQTVLAVISPELAQPIQDALNKIDKRMILAETIAVASDIIAQQKPACILIDAQMVAQADTLKKLFGDTPPALPIGFIGQMPTALEKLFPNAPRAPLSIPVPIIPEHLSQMLLEMTATSQTQKQKALLIDVKKLFADEQAQLQTLGIDISPSMSDAIKKTETTYYNDVLLWVGHAKQSLKKLQTLMDKIKARSGRLSIFTNKDLAATFKEQLAEYSDRTFYLNEDEPFNTQYLTQFLKTLDSTAIPRTGTGAAKKKKIAVPKQLRHKKILLVDDDMRNIYALSMMLKKCTFEVVVAKNGQDGLEKLAQQNGRIDLVLMDIMMPVMDGYQAIEKIREQARFSALPIYVLTANDTPDIRKRCDQFGVNGYVPKPVDITHLIEAIAQSFATTRSSTT